MSFEMNKIAAAVLVAMILAMVTGIVADMLVHPKPLQQQAYVVPGVERTTPADAPAGDAGPKPIEPLLASANPAAGQEVAKRCAACHTFEAGGGNKVGPNLHGILGADIAAKPGFQYSPALAGKEGNWDPESLNQFLYKPQGYARGTKMAFAGLPKDDERANVIAYLQSLK